MTFPGFDKDIRRFFHEIGQHRDSALWFEENRRRFELSVRDPMRQMAAALSDAALFVDERFETRPSKVVARIRRDTRFSRDKSLYRDHLWLAFKQGGSRLSEGICLYFEADERGIGWGMGFYQATPSEMAAIRGAILAKSSGFIELISDERVTSAFRLDGPEYKRLPKGCENVDERLLPWLVKKSVSLSHYESWGDDAWDGRVAERISSDFRALKPLYDFIAGAAERAERSR